MPEPVVRVSQRRPRACQGCSKKKIKCDKLLPCARCRRLNLECTREVVKIKSNVTQHAAEVSYLESIIYDLEEASRPGDLRPIIQRLKDRTARLQYGDEPMPSAQSQHDPSHALRLETEDSQQNQTQQQQQPKKDHGSVDESILTTLEHLAWGRASGRCFPHRACGCQYGTGKLFPSFSLIGSSSYDSEKPTVLVAIDDAKKLIQFHLDHLVWHHNCLHSPTFLEQCDEFWTTGQCAHPLWYALYLSVLSSTIFAIQTSSKSRAIIDAGLDTGLPPAQDVFAAMMDALWGSDFLQNAVLYSVQAIAISTEIAHNLGLSQLNATLLNAAIRLAQDLGLHTINPRHNADLDWKTEIETEVGKRVWCQLIIQDHFAIPFTDSHVISPAHFCTPPPRNLDDDSLSEMPTHLPTVSSYVRVLLEMANLMPDLQDGLGPMSNRKPLRQQYEHILRVDTRMRAIVRGFPAFLLRQDAQHEAKLPWLGTARRSLAITAAEKIIMIHRPFLLRSFQTPQYNFTRRTCTAAARTILSQHEALIEANDLSIWTHTAFCITAAVILCFEIRNPRDMESPEQIQTTAEMHKKAVVAARIRLAHRENDILAQRGVTLIDILLDSPASEADVSTFGSHVISEFNRIMMDASAMQHPSDQAEAAPQPLLLNIFSYDNISHDIGTMEYSTMDIGMEYTGNDFEQWFNDIFAEV